jgi:hypothetical protein
MRTEDDLRAALTALERHAPAAARVLPGAPGRTARGLRSPRTIRWAAGMATAAALAGVVTALTLPGGTSGTSKEKSGVASSAPITSATLQAKLTAAFSSALDKVAVEHATYRVNSEAPVTDETWSYPLQPSLGQQVRTRTIDTSQSGTFHTDTGESYLMPPVPKTSYMQATSEVTTVSYTGKVWWQQQISSHAVTPPVGPELIANLPPLGKWTAHNTTLNGRPAIEFTLHTTSKAGKIKSWFIDNLWVDASTYLPLRETSDDGSTGFDTVGTSDYEYLPATPANLAKLTPPIPAGFKRVYPAPLKVGKIPSPSGSPGPVHTSSR